MSAIKHTSLFILCSLLLFSAALGQMERDRDDTAASSGSAKKTAAKTTILDAETSISPIDSPLNDIMWCGNDHNNIIVLSDKGTVYHSSDLGRSWDKKRDIFLKIGKKEADDEENVGSVNKMLQSPVDKKLVIFLGSTGINWISEDCGATVKAINSGRNIKEFQFHPSERAWILASAYTTCDDFENGEPCRIYKELYVSKNLGDSWEFVADYVIQFSWGLQHAYFSLYMPRERIVIAHHLHKKGNQKNTGWSEKAEIAYSDDFFKTKSVIIDRGNKFLINENYFFAVQVDDEDVQDVRLYVGNPGARNYQLNPIELPRKNKKKNNANQVLEHSYTILDSSEGQVFLHINHEGDKSKYGNIYISDATGLRYTLSLHNNVRSSNGQCDFERVQGLEGIYISNVYDPEMVKKLKNDFVDDAIPTSQQSSKPKSGTKQFETAATEGKSSDKRYKELDEYKQTVISFDKGGIWEPIRPPKVDVDGARIDCENEEICMLQLHSLSNTKFGPFYTTENSLGIVLGTGNVGKHLSNKQDEINTYLSRDGGLTWFEVLRGSHIYEIGDHGAIIVAAPDQEATKTVQYSWNEGLTWETLKISDAPIYVSNIIIEPSNTAEHFILYGRTSVKGSKGEERGVVVSIDFASLHERDCVLPDKPNDNSSDYETWSPNGPIVDSCLMGHEITYIRRKREAECFNREEWDRWYSYKNCVCTEEDWECDIGYERTKAGPCESKTDTVPSYEPPAECYGDYYYVTQGYRKVAGDTCEGGVDHEPIRLPCPGRGISKANIIVLLALGSLIAGLCFLSNKSYANKAKRFAMDFGEKAKSSTTTSFSRLGFKRMGEDEEPDSLNDHDDDFDSRLRFDDHDEPAQHLEDRNLMDVVKGGKKMAGRSGLDTAQKNIPMISKPNSLI